MRFENICLKKSFGNEETENLWKENENLELSLNIEEKNSGQFLKRHSVKHILPTLCRVFIRQLHHFAMYIHES